MNKENLLECLREESKARTKQGFREGKIRMKANIEGYIHVESTIKI